MAPLARIVGISLGIGGFAGVIALRLCHQMPSSDSVVLSLCVGFVAALIGVVAAAAAEIVAALRNKQSP